MTSAQVTAVSLTYLLPFFLCVCVKDFLGCGTTAKRIRVFFYKSGTEMVRGPQKHKFSRADVPKKKVWDVLSSTRGGGNLHRSFFEKEISLISSMKVKFSFSSLNPFSP